MAAADMRAREEGGGCDHRSTLCCPAGGRMAAAAAAELSTSPLFTTMAQQVKCCRVCLQPGVLHRAPAGSRRGQIAAYICCA